VSNNWAEFSWAPANDDGTVVQYNIYRSDGVIYRIRQDQTDPGSGPQADGPQVSRQPMNIVNYLVAGSAWAPTPDASNTSLFPFQFEADYIRVYQREEFQGTATFGQ
jgi:hypothetical protein